ncbi:MAG: hypothetical protein IPK55_12550 [Streptococcus sp.]|nr:hypothetical protein [Streptococcus sp.]
MLEAGEICDDGN